MVQLIPKKSLELFGFPVLSDYCPAHRDTWIAHSQAGEWAGTSKGPHEESECYCLDRYENLGRIPELLWLQRVCVTRTANRNRASLACQVLGYSPGHQDRQGSPARKEWDSTPDQVGLCSILSYCYFPPTRDS
jgi:hypothetical protein